LYTYFIVPSISLFGLNAFSVRFPSALFGGASVFLIFFLAVKLFEKNKSKYGIGLFSAFLLAISPWPLGLSRIGIESNTGITLLLLTILLFIYSLKKPKLFLITAFIASLSLYTYTSYFFFMPIVLLVLSLFYRIAILKHKKYFFTGLLVFILLVFPLFIFRSAGGTRASQVSFINSQDNVGITLMTGEEAVRKFLVRFVN
jgi:4-amino-4-deoxy-L-arabinose transferase-like glycosyltransferase